MEDKKSLLALVVIVLGLAIAYFHFNLATTQPEQQPVQPVPVPPTTPPQQQPQPAPPGKINSYEDALKAAKAANRQIYLYFTASWCTWCQKFERETLSSPRVQNELNNYIVYKIDVDKERALATKYGISGVPAHRIIDVSEKTIKSDQGFKGEAAFILWLKTARLEQ